MSYPDNRPEPPSGGFPEPAELFQHALDALGERIAILDPQGCILWANRAWQRFAARPQAPAFAAACAGANYLELCRRDAESCSVTRDTLFGIYSVLEGLLERFSLEYCLEVLDGVCGWYVMTAIPLHAGSGGLILTHREISSQKLAEQDRDRLNLDLQYAMDGMHTLSTLLPLCGACGRHRDDAAYFDQIATYFAQNRQIASFGICPECHDRLIASRHPDPPPVQDDLFAGLD